MPHMSRAKTAKDFTDRVITYRDMGMDPEYIAKTMGQKIDMIQEIIDQAILAGTEFPPITITKPKSFSDYKEVSLNKNYVVGRPKITDSSIMVKNNRIGNLFFPEGHWLFTSK